MTTKIAPKIVVLDYRVLDGGVRIPYPARLPRPLLEGAFRRFGWLWVEEAPTK